MCCLGIMLPDLAWTVGDGTVHTLLHTYPSLGIVAREKVSCPTGSYGLAVGRMYLLPPPAGLWAALGQLFLSSWCAGLPRSDPCPAPAPRRLIRDSMRLLGTLLCWHICLCSLSALSC
eukprot:EG_transcript_8960